jgi:hypothetical protein
MNGWEIHDKASDYLCLNNFLAIESFVKSYGPLAAVDAASRTLVVLQHYHPGFNCSPQDKTHASDDYVMGLAYYCISHETYFLLPRSLQYKSIELLALPSADSSELLNVDIIIKTDEYGETHTNITELRERLPNYLPDGALPYSEARLLKNFTALVNARPALIKVIPVTSTAIYLTAIGTLQRGHFDDWWTTNVHVPLVQAELCITLAGYNPQDSAHEPVLKKSDAAITAFLRLTMKDRQKASAGVLKNCLDFIDDVREDDWNRSMARCQHPEDIWAYVHPKDVHMQFNEETSGIYISLLCECDWEQEHGLQLVYRDGHQLIRISQQDGHLFDDE